MVVCSLYAPLDFYQSSAEWIGKLSRHGPLLVLGDFNARLHTRFATEDHRFGEHIFGDSQAEPHPESSWQLLLELCEALDLVVGNTFFAQPPSRQVTVFNVGSNPNSALIPANFGQRNFILTHKDWLHVLQDVASCMDIDMALASHHFPIIVQLDIAIPKRAGQPGSNCGRAIFIGFATKWEARVALNAGNFSPRLNFNDWPAPGGRTAPGGRIQRTAFVGCRGRGSQG